MTFPIKNKMIYAITCFFCGFKFEATDKDINDDRFIDDRFNGLIRCPRCEYIYNKSFHKHIIKGIVVDFKIKEEKIDDQSQRYSVAGSRCNMCGS